MQTVRVIHRHEADGWWAETPDVEGWSAAGDTYARDQARVLVDAYMGAATVLRQGSGPLPSSKR
jgi:predicted RNase H-like HicB family nuclease